MLRHLSIRNIVLIQTLDLDFESGLTVLTGETGAGKSILLDALGLVCGSRADTGLIRAGTEQAVVTAQFDLLPGHPVYDICADIGLSDPEGEVVLRRVVEKSGRSKAFLNDQPVAVVSLRRVGRALIEVHGQHDDQSLLNPATHRVLLDTFSDLNTTYIASLWRTWEAAEEELATYQKTVAQSQEDADYLEHAVKELHTLATHVGEEDTLDAQRRRMQVAQRVRKDVEQSVHDVGAQGVEGILYGVQKRLSRVQEQTEGLVDKGLEALGHALSSISEATEAIETALVQLEFDPTQLEQVEERLFELRRIARKHGVRPDELPELEKSFTARLNAVEHSEEQMLVLEQAVDTARATYAEEAYALHAQRLEAAKRLDAAVMVELPALRMEAAFFQTDVEEVPLANAQQHGVTKVTFTARTNPGAHMGAIDKIASGGELSRFLLALKVCLTQQGQQTARPTVLVFDEIDRGVGGPTADAVGARLQALAAQGQVLVITHSPQVASKGHQHFYIEKHYTSEGATQTSVSILTKARRVQEIARMLSGKNITPEAQSAAHRLLTMGHG